MDSVLPIAKKLLSHGHALVVRHPRRFSAVLIALLGGFAVTAFGIAPLAPDAANLPQHLVSETLQVPGLDRQLVELAEKTLELNRSGLTRSQDTADSLLRRLGVNDPSAAAFLRVDRNARLLVEGSPGKMIQVRSAADGTLIELVARFPSLDASRATSHFTRLTVKRAQGELRAALETAALVPQVRLGSGTVRSSLWAATDDARLPDAIAMQLVDIFSGDIDFHRQLRKGDTFSVAFEAMTADDQPISWNQGTGRIVAAEFINNGKSLQAVWYQGTAKGGYFGPDGRSRRKSFLASPMEFSRVTSGFAMRFHPILQSWRAHNGVDYGAPAGTPVRSVADGVVETAGRQNGYGNVVQLQHGAGKTTIYAHLTKIDVRQGQRIEQGQRIGTVGSTGWATGPHLHFEFRVGGRFQDPLKVARDSDSLSIDPSARPQFMKLANLAKNQLAAATTMVGFNREAE